LTSSTVLIVDIRLQSYNSQRQAVDVKCGNGDDDSRRQ